MVAETRVFHRNYANSALTKSETARTSAFRFRAQMAELVDALRSGRSVLLDVEVRVLFWAPIYSPKWFYFIYIYPQNTDWSG